MLNPRFSEGMCHVYPIDLQTDGSKVISNVLQSSAGQEAFPTREFDRCLGLYRADRYEEDAGASWRL